MKATPRKLAYTDSDKEAPAGSLPKGFFDQFSLESFGTSDTRRQTRSTIKIRKTPSKNKEPTHLKRSRRLEDQVHNQGKGKKRKVQVQEKEKLNDKIPKTMDEMFEMVQAFIRGEVDVGSAKWFVLLKGTKDTFIRHGLEDLTDPEIGTPKGILSIESISFTEPPPLIRTPEKQNLNKLCDYHRDRGHNTNDCYQLRKQIEEAVASGKLAHLVKDICQNNQRNGNPGRNSVKKPRCQQLVKTQKVQDSNDRFFKGNISSLRSNGSSSNFGEGKSKTVLMKFAIIKCHSPYNIIIGRTEMRSLGVVGSTIYSMIKFPTNQGVVTIETSREALQEYKHLEMVQGSWKEVQWCQREEKMSRIREQVILSVRFIKSVDYVV
nr:hypothetical protein [Tanacetum cinerariifolium]